MANVVNVKTSHLRQGGCWDLIEWLKYECNVYIGRYVHNVPGADKSYWVNPFSFKRYGREESLELYKQMVKNTPEMMVKLMQLKGKTLGCWCYPERCHGNILSELIIEEEEKQRKIKELTKNSTLQKADKILLSK